MSDIFISYKREEQPEARKLANALEREGWEVWWDPKLRAGEHFDDVIEKALMESKCVVVMWSKLSVNSRYVRDEATYALNRGKLVPVGIERVVLPFRFEGLHTPSLIDWDGSDGFAEFQKLVEDITDIIGKPARETRKPQTLRKRRRAAPQPPIKVDGREPGTLFRDRLLKDGSSGPEMIVIPAGTFQMGDIDGTGADNQKPVHTAHIRNSFGLGRFQVTFDEYDNYCKLTSVRCRKTRAGVGGGGQSLEFHGMKLWNMRSGCLRRQPNAIGYRRRRSGSMPRAAGEKTKCGPALPRSKSWATTQSSASVKRTP